jgi:hypothetical protein
MHLQLVRIELLPESLNVVFALTFEQVKRSRELTSIAG